MIEHHQAIFDALRDRRITLGFSQSNVGVISGYSEYQVNRWECGRRDPRCSSLLNWCDALGVRLQVIDAPDAELRRLWTKLGVSVARQNDMIAEITRKAQPEYLASMFGGKP